MSPVRFPARVLLSALASLLPRSLYLFLYLLPPLIKVSFCPLGLHEVCALCAYVKVGRGVFFFPKTIWLVLGPRDPHQRHSHGWSLTSLPRAPIQSPPLQSRHHAFLKLLSLPIESFGPFHLMSSFEPKGNLREIMIPFHG